MDHSQNNVDLLNRDILVLAMREYFNQVILWPTNLTTTLKLNDTHTVALWRNSYLTQNIKTTLNNISPLAHQEVPPPPTKQLLSNYRLYNSTSYDNNINPNHRIILDHLQHTTGTI